MKSRDLQHAIILLEEKNKELQIKNQKLEVESATKSFKLAQAEEKCKILEEKLSEKQYTDIDALTRKNQDLIEEVQALKFSVANDTSTITLQTENAKLASTVAVQKDEIKYLKQLLETYRSMPDVKQMIENLASLSVPNIDKLRDFAQMVSENKLSELCDLIKQNIQTTERALSSRYSRF